MTANAGSNCICGICRRSGRLGRTCEPARARPGAQVRNLHSRGRLFRHAQLARSGHRGGSFGHGSHSSHQGHSSLNALPAQRSTYAPSIQGSSMPCSSSGYPGAQGSIQSTLLVAGRGCFECGDLGHIKRFCPCFTKGSSQQRS
uniref:DNA-binding protein HEXBP-like n=1 Tax=Nicotiana sylvestris TaxID=4096 RepID=A0A1U7Y4R0_NICSY|nr:PREDICTED: DNA-binding protein HEXBP-like [Nicotiana sylvestris]